jgi:hypothetical protein
MVKFRFQDLEIWQLAIQIAHEPLERFLDQLDHLCRKITNFQGYMK